VRSLLIGAALALVLAAPSQSTAGWAIDNASLRAFDPLLYEHIVVKGRVAKVTRKRILTKKLGYEEYQDSDAEVFIQVVTLQDANVLRGAELPKDFAFKWQYQTRGLLDKEVILCASWLSPLQAYIISYGLQCLVESGSGVWSSYDGTETLTTAEVEAALESTRPESVARSADVGVIGHVASVADSTVEENGRPIVLRKVRLQIDELLKGQYQRPEIEFAFALVSGMHAPPWMTETPREYKIGETWIAFLTRGPDFYYPCCGKNGVLQVKGDTLLYDRLVPIKYSRGKFLKLVQEAIHD